MVHVAVTSGLIAVHADALQLEVRVIVVRSFWAEAVLVRDGLPELDPDLIAAYITAAADAVLSLVLLHCCCCCCCCWGCVGCDCSREVEENM